jgi:hypothetical protein
MDPAPLYVYAALLFSLGLIIWVRSILRARRTRRRPTYRIAISEVLDTENHLRTRKHR